MSTTIAIVLLLAVTAYVIFGGADFGAGLWDLVAGGPQTGERPRAVIEHGIGPVWEANHVWLIFIFVITWTAFPEGFAAITLTMFVPLTLAALGIVFRGAGFAFRKAVVRTKYKRWFGGAFALSSLLVPFCFGAIAGGIASEQIPAGGKAGDPVSSWLNPTSIVVGVLGVILVAHLAAVYLVRVAHREGDLEMVSYFRVRALGSGLLVVVVGVIGAFILHAKASYFFDGLTSRAAPLLVLAVLAGAASLTLLWWGALRGGRLAAAVAVAALVFTGMVAQWPYMLPQTLKYSEAAAPNGTLITILVATGLAAALVLPGFALLYVLDQRDLLEEEGVADIGDELPPAYVDESN
jgi:cytochrome d ubiquinol oxidase subunit II